MTLNASMCEWFNDACLAKSGKRFKKFSPVPIKRIAYLQLLTDSLMYFIFRFSRVHFPLPFAICVWTWTVNCVHSSMWCIDPIHKWRLFYLCCVIVQIRIMNWQPFMNNVYGICEFFRIKIVVVVVFQIGIIIALYSQPTFRHHQEAQVGHFCPKEASQSKKKKDVRRVWWICQPHHIWLPTTCTPKWRTCIQRHNNAASYIHWKVCQSYNIKTTDKWYELKPQIVIENEQPMAVWNIIMPIRTDREIVAN